MSMNYESCTLCPRMCGADRTKAPGFCGASHQIKAARAALHQWEEPCISGTAGSGTVFFSGCTLKCVFCQNYPLSHENFGKEISTVRLAEIFLELQEKGAHNINLVTATQYLPSIRQALELARPELHIPVVYNSGGYERTETIREFSDCIDIWLPDLKYYDSSLSEKYSAAQNYFSMASKAIKEMIRISGGLAWDPENPGLLKKGVVIRHMVLPGHKDDSIKLLHWIHDHFPQHQYLVSLLSQYTPYTKNPDYPQLNRRITSYEYNKVVDTALELGMTDGFMQQKSSAKEEYTPPFNLEGL